MNRPGGLLSIVRSNLLFAVLLVSGAVLRLLVVLAYQPVFMLQKDTYVYLSLAVAPNFTPVGFRPVLYSLFLKPLLVFGNLMVVPVAQHIAGLAMAVILYAMLRRLGVGPVPSALGTAPLLLDGYQIDIEHYLLTEALFQLLIVAAMALLAWQTRPAPVFVALAGLLLSLTVLTRFVGVILIVPALAYVLVRRLGWLRFAVLALAFVLPLALYSLWFKSSSGTFGVTDRNGFFLYGRVASFADCSRVELPDKLRRFCLKEPLSGPNYGIWRLDVNLGRLLRRPHANGLLLEYSKRMILAQPGDYARVVAADLLRFFSPTTPPAQEPYVRRWRFPRTLSDADPNPFVRQRGGSAPARMNFEEFQIEPSLADRLRAYQSVGYTPGPVLALMLALGVLGSVLGLALPEGRNLRAECLLFGGGALVLLLFPVMTTVYHFRYVLPVLPLLGPSGALGVAVVLGWVRRRSNQADARAA